MIMEFVIKFVMGVVAVFIILSLMLGWGAYLAAGISSVSATETLTIGSYNIHKASPNNKAGVPDWPLRRDRLINTLEASAADVVSLQEVSRWKVRKGVTHRQDVALLASQRGFATVEAELNKCPRPRDCDNTTAIVYQTANVTIMPNANGLPSTAKVLNSDVVLTPNPDENKRAMTWAYFMKSGKPFLVLDIHTDSDKSPLAEAGRVALGNSLTTYIEGLNNARGLPTIATFLTGDFNSYKFRQPGGMQKILEGNQWGDPYYTAPVKRGERYATINKTPATAKFNGFPPRPYQYSLKKEPTRIDYVLYKNATPLSYETLIKFYDDCTYMQQRLFKCNFHEEYRLSDHNMVLGTFNWSVV